MGALAGCLITALIGFGTVVWYGWGGLDEGELEEEVKRKIDAKRSRGGLIRRLRAKD